MSNPLSLQTLPPSTRAVLASSPGPGQNQGVSTPSNPSSPISTSSSGHGHSQAHTQVSHAHNTTSNYPDADTLSITGGGGVGRTPRPGTSLININATSQNLSNSSTNLNSSTGSGRPRVMRGGSGGEHLGTHEHHTYSGQLDDFDDLGSPPLTASSYRTYTPGYQSTTYPANQGYQQSPGYSPYGTAYGSPRQTSSNLRSRALPTPSALADQYTNPNSPATGLHTLHSKGSNLSTSTFMPTRHHERSEREGRENGVSSSAAGDGSSPLTPTPGAVTPTPGNVTPFTPSHLNPNAGAGSKSSFVDPTRNGEERPSSTVHVQSGGSGNAVVKKSSAATTLTNATAASSQSPRIKDRRSGRTEREREREGDGHRRPKIRTIPHLPHGPGEIAPSTVMYWSRAPVYGHLPSRSMRAHSVTLVDGMAWLFGGCDERGCARDVWCCDVETFQWTHPPLTGDIPPPCRAHTATLVDGKRIFIFGGGEGPTYYNTLYILDTQTRRFTWVPCGQKPPGSTVVAEGTEASSSGPSTPSSVNPSLPTPSPHTSTTANGVQPMSGPSNSITNAGQNSAAPAAAAAAAAPPMPLPRRAHTAVLYRSKLYIFGGGNGVKALNDVWSLDTSVPVERMRWEQIKTSGPRPGPRGYHTANLVGNIMIVVGGSDGRECFSDIWVLNLDTLVWTLVDTDKEYKRLSHSSTQVGSYLFIMGGHDGLKYSSELLLFNLVTLQFEHKLTMGRPPPARGYHISLLADARLLVFGGFDGHSVYDDVWLLDLAGAAYLPQVTSFALLIDGGH